MAGKTTDRGAKENVTIVIRRDEGEEPAHHGGAWKVAYADFVTAMMAFFLLMWLLNATTEEQRTGLADYFAPTNLFGRSASGSGQPFGGQTPNDSGTSVSTAGTPRINRGRQPQPHDVPEDDEADVPTRPPIRLAVNDDETNGSGQVQGQGQGQGQGQSEGRNGASSALQPGQGRQALLQGGDYAEPRISPAAPQTPEAIAAAQAQRREATIQGDIRRERQALDQAGAQMLEAIRRDPALQDLAGQLTVEDVPAGLRIQIVDDVRRPMFSLGSSQPTKQVRDLMRKVAPMLAGLPNAISIAGHTDSLTYRGQEKGNWELSTERANATRRVLAESGLAEDRIRSVTGNADRDLLLPGDPFNPVNRRITIIVLRHAGADKTGPAAP